MQAIILQNIRELINAARESVNRHIDSTMTLPTFLVGRYIVVDKQQGEERAKYADETLSFLGTELTKEFGKGFSSRNLAQMKKFYITYQNYLDITQILQTKSAKSIQFNEKQDVKPILQNNSAKSTQYIDIQIIETIYKNFSRKSISEKKAIAEKTEKQSRILKIGINPKKLVYYFMVALFGIVKHKPSRFLKPWTCFLGPPKYLKEKYQNNQYAGVVGLAWETSLSRGKGI